MYILKEKEREVFKIFLRNTQYSVHCTSKKGVIYSSDPNIKSAASFSAISEYHIHSNSSALGVSKT